jgi:hypothetical protein
MDRPIKFHIINDNGSRNCGHMFRRGNLRAHFFAHVIDFVGKAGIRKTAVESA